MQSKVKVCIKLPWSPEEEKFYSEKVRKSFTEYLRFKLLLKGLNPWIEIKKSALEN